jgi:hypothetical protein
VARLTGALHAELSIFFITSRRILVGIKNISDKLCRENRNAHFMFNDPFPQNGAFYEIIWENVVELDRTQMTIKCEARKMCRACWITKAII